MSADRWCIFCHNVGPVGGRTFAGEPICVTCQARMDEAPKPSAREELVYAAGQDLDSEYWMGRSLSEYIDDYRDEVLREAAKKLRSDMALQGAGGQYDIGMKRAVFLIDPSERSES